MYSDKSNRKAHLLDFNRVLSNIESETQTQERDYRIKVLKECISRCSD